MNRCRRIYHVADGDAGRTRYALPADYGRGVSPEIPAPISTGATPPPVDGAALWAELHRYALTEPAPEAAAAWLASFGGRLPCGPCRAHWRELLTAYPPPFDRQGDFFAWSVDRHNDVSRRLGKPEMLFAVALDHWTAPPPPALP